MGRQKKTQKFAAVKRIINPRKDDRLQKKEKTKDKKSDADSERVHGKKEVNQVPQVASQLFFNYNTSLGPPYRILLDTNFINFAVSNKLDITSASMDCLYAKCFVYVTSCVMSELELMGQKYRVALLTARKFEVLPCNHKGHYADDCLVDRAKQFGIYIIATNDKDLKRRIRKVPGVPIMSVKRGRFQIERLPDVGGGVT